MAVDQLRRVHESTNLEGFDGGGQPEWHGAVGTSIDVDRLVHI